MRHPRVDAPDGKKDDNGRLLKVLKDGTVLRDTYSVSYYSAGGMSIIYKAMKGEELLCIKEVDCSDPKNLFALSQEKATLDRLDHPGIIKAYDCFEEDGHYYLVMDFIAGRSLDTFISRKKTEFVDTKVLDDWASQLFDIFEYLHRQSPPIIYRDLKPQNILCDAKNRLHLIDFGIARVYKDSKSNDTSPMGTALTASPEQYGGKQTDARSDIFTIGATLHILATNGKGSGAGLFEFLPARSVNPGLSDTFEKTMQKALEILPEDRFKSIREMRDAYFKKSYSAAFLEINPRAGMDPEALESATAPEAKKPEPVKGAGVPLALFLPGIILLTVIGFFAIRASIMNKPADTGRPSAVTASSKQPQVSETSLQTQFDPGTGIAVTPSDGTGTKRTDEATGKEPVKSGATDAAITPTGAPSSDHGTARGGSQAQPPGGGFPSSPPLSAAPVSPTAAPAVTGKGGQVPQILTPSATGSVISSEQGTTVTFQSCQVTFPEGYSQKTDKSNPSLLEYDRKDNQNIRWLTVQVGTFPPQAFASTPPDYIYYLRDNFKAKDIQYVGTEIFNGTTGYVFTYKKEVVMGWLKKTGTNRHVVFVGKDSRTYMLTAGSFSDSLRDSSADFDSFFKSFKLAQ